MKFLNYLTEDEKMPDIVRLIKRDCKPWLSTISSLIGTGKCFIRHVTMKNYVTNITKFTPRTDREPRDSSQKLHDLVDNELFKKFNWKPRSEGVFVWPVKKISSLDVFDGLYNVFYPIGEFKYVWSPKIKDLFNLQLQVLKSPDEYIKSYTNKNLLKTFKGQLNFGQEVMFKCDSYYLVNAKFIGLLKENKLL